MDEFRARVSCCAFLIVSITAKYKQSGIKESLIVSLRCPKSHIIILSMHYFECKECAFIEVYVKQCGRTEERHVQTFDAVAEVANRGICLLAS